MSAAPVGTPFNKESNRAARPEGTGPDHRASERSSDKRRTPWFHPRPNPHRRIDVLGLNSLWWTIALLVATVILTESWWW